MLKGFCDCIAAGVREERDVYGTQMNGNNLRAPLWPEGTDSEKMFLLPRKLNVGDQINVTAEMLSNPRWVSISLTTGSSKPDYNNTAGQLELHFPLDNSDNGKTILKTITNGRIEETPVEIKSTDLIPDYNTSAVFTINIVNKGDEIEFYVGESYIEAVHHQHNVDDLTYITLNGDVKKIEKLEFIFAS